MNVRGMINTKVVVDDTSYEFEVAGKVVIVKEISDTQSKLASTEELKEKEEFKKEVPRPLSPLPKMPPPFPQ